MPDGAAYETGYGKPPVDTRFRKGISGNPRGRTKGAKNKTPALNEERMKTILIEEAYRTISVRDGERNLKMPVIKAVIRGIALAAAKGQQRSQRVFTSLLQTTEKGNKALADEHLKTMIEYKAGWESELERRKREGIIAPDPIPHPDDIVIDFKTGTVRIEGPFTKEEKTEWDKMLEPHDTIQSWIDNLAHRMERQPKSRKLKRLRLEIQGKFDLFNDQLPKRYQTTLKNRIIP
jgi:uncharacterized protein DUF5681